MKKFGKIAAIVATSALALVLGAVALIGCNGVSGDPYTFEAEDAVLADPATAQSKMALETKNEWTGTEEPGDEATNIGYFSTAGQTITWKVTAAEACSVTIKLRASSCAFGLKSKGKFYAMAEMEDIPEDQEAEWAIGELKAKDCGAVVKVNGKEASMKGTLPETATGVDKEDFMGMMGIFSIVHYGEYTIKAKLNKGENTIVLENVGGGFNVDKITVYSKVELTFTKTDNTDRKPANPWG